MNTAPFHPFAFDSGAFDVASGFVTLDSFALEMEFSGAGSGWTAVTGDVRAQIPVRFRYGINGSGLMDRVAAPGSMTFALNNATTNSGGLLGYYAPGHANCRSGFALGINVRLKLTYEGTTYYKFHGRLSHIQPMPGQYGARMTLCTVFDWMDEASRAKLKRLAIQESKRADEILTTIKNAMVRGPVSSTFGVGRDTYVYALDKSPEEGAGVLTEFQRIALSEVGNIYVKGNTTAGGELVFESRTDRAGKNTNLATFDNAMYDLAVSRSRDDIISRLQVVTHPKSKDASNVVLFTLRDSTVSTATVITLAPGESKTIVAPYTNPSNRSERIGAVSTSCVSPVATTDYLMNAAADGSSTNLTANLTVTPTFGASASFLTLANGHATSTGYITFLQVRGPGIYDQQAVIAERTSSTSEAAFGEQTITYDMPYQSDPDVGFGASLYFLALLEAQMTTVGAVAIKANTNASLMAQALTREPGDRIGLAEAASGLTTTTGFFIQSCEGVLTKGGIVTMAWGLTPASAQQFWLLGNTGSSELGDTTYLAF